MLIVTWLFLPSNEESSFADATSIQHSRFVVAAPIPSEPSMLFLSKNLRTPLMQPYSIPSSPFW